MDEIRRAQIEKLRANFPEGTLLDEELVPEYTLPDPLICADGTPVADAADWFARRRPEIMALFEEHMFGRSPEPPAGMRFEVRGVDRGALGGRATRKEVRIYLTEAEHPRIDLLLYVPNGVSRKPATWVGLNLLGNQSIVDDPGVTLYDGWVPDLSRLGMSGAVVNNRATDASRATWLWSMPVERILAKGQAVATACCSDIAPDLPDVFEHGVFSAYLRHGEAPAADEWGVLAAWAWGMCRMLDYLVTDPDVDPARVIAHGTSRLGKAALWAGALDERWWMISPNESGCGGAALSRRRYGETVARINTTFPNWFCKAFHAYNDKEDALPFDQHMLIALSAPRPIYIASGEDDLWEDPRGEFLGAQGADPVYRLLGTDGLVGADGEPVVAMPAVHAPLHGTLAYHVRSGGHGVNEWDWDQFLAYAAARL